MVVDAPQVCDGPMVTNDIGTVLPSSQGGAFRILGRKDNVVCSGGIKIQAEEVERLLAPSMKKPFAITKRTDEKYGEIVVLLTKEDNLDAVKEVCEAVLPKYWRPRIYLHIDALPTTETGKPARKRMAEIAEAADV